MKYYHAFNLCIASELEFPELTESQAEADVTISFSKVGSFPKTKQENNLLVGEVPEVGEFLIRDGREIVINPLPGVDEALLRIVVLGPVLCVLLRQRGFLVLHASCVDINNKGVAFIGGSGWGKSTLVTTFHTHGYNVLTDDVLPIKIEKDKAFVFPSYPQFKLCKDAATSLGQNTKSLLPVSKNSYKVAYKLSSGFQKEPIQLQQLYILGKGDEHKITSVKQQEAFIELVRHTRAINTITEDKFITEHLQYCSELIKSVRFCRFIRKPSLEDLPKLVKLVEDDIAKMNEEDNKTDAVTPIIKTTFDANKINLQAYAT
ncbi:MAG: hypothetical protein KME29_23500 [Calothrix sp. FI2-JRJ7]|jgi:hypothetical protein|nr:hypothetical protein [Calothrix sp. FI2-JRJ7]